MDLEKKQELKGAPLYTFIPLGAGICFMEEMPSKIFGGALILAGLTALYVDGLTPKTLIQGIGGFACLPYDSLKYALTKYKKIKRARNIQQIRLSRTNGIETIVA